MYDLLLSGSGEEGFGSSTADDHQRAPGLSHQTFQTKKELKDLDKYPKWLPSQKKVVLFINQRFFRLPTETRHTSEVTRRRVDSDATNQPLLYKRRHNGLRYRRARDTGRVLSAARSACNW